MFPAYIVEVLQQLSYLALIIICPCTIYTTIGVVKLGVNLDNHVDNDHSKHITIDHHLGKHDSQIHDLQMDSAARNGKLSL